MSKISILSFLLLLFVTSVTAQIIPAPPGVIDVGSMMLKGRVKSITQSYYDVKYNENTASPYKNALDSAAVINYYLKLQGQDVYSFDTNGFLKERYLFDTLGAALQTFYSYDRGGLSTIANYRDGKRIDSFYFKNSKGHIASHKMDVRYCTVYDARGRYTGNIMYTYSRGNLVAIRKKDKDNVMQEMIRYKFKNGILVEKGVYKGDMQLVKSSKIHIENRKDDMRYLSEMEYDIKGRLLGMISFLDDDKGNHIEETIADSNRRVTSQKINEYNNRNEITSQTVFADSKNNYRFNYTYDSFDNWTKKQIFRNDTLSVIIERKFEYAE